MDDYDYDELSYYLAHFIHDHLEFYNPITPEQIYQLIKEFNRSLL